MICAFLICDWAVHLSLTQCFRAGSPTLGQQPASERARRLMPARARFLSPFSRQNEVAAGTATTPKRNTWQAKACVS